LDPAEKRMARLTRWVLYRITDRPQNSFKARLVVTAVVLALGALDFLTGVRISLQFFYLFPIALAVAWLGWRTGILTSVACMLVRQGSDYLDGLHIINPGVLAWNRLVEFGVYFTFVWIFSALVRLHREMESQVVERTSALTEEIALRERLEGELMSITEKERWSIGHDLHDGLCQHFTGTALAAQSLVRRLEKDGHPASSDAQRIVALVEDGIGQTRRLARGLLLVSVEVDGLVHALRELASSSFETFRVACDFSIEGELPATDTLMATHVFRIAQEALRNAARHGQAQHLGLAVTVGPTETTMRISDDGVGLPAEPRLAGMGRRIMARRAQIIGATLRTETAPGKGTVITCIWPNHRSLT
jgi:signal transduction histidine kinase